MLWTVLERDGQQVVSYAGWWRLLVSQPLFLSLLLTWFWRLFLWARCIRRIARMDVRIIASHPDHAGGLGFLGQSLRGFPILAFAFGSAVAGTLANLVIHEGHSPTTLTPVIIATIAFILLISAGPLLAFIRPMREAQDDAELSYGALATSVGQRFEERWLPRANDVPPDALGVTDFSATTDLFSVVANVTDMRPIPIEIKDFAAPPGGDGPAISAHHPAAGLLRRPARRSPSACSCRAPEGVRLPYGPISRLCLRAPGALPRPEPFSPQPVTTRCTRVARTTARK